MNEFTYTKSVVHITADERREMAESLGIDYERYVAEKAKWEATASPEAQQAAKDALKSMMHTTFFGLDASPFAEASDESGIGPIPENEEI